jgi:hypothetical protein
MADFQVQCGECKTDLRDESPHIAPSDRKPCSNCGSLTRHFIADLTALVNFKGSIGAVKFLGGVSKTKGRVVEFFDGWEPRRVVGDLVRKFRKIDKENDKYQEHVETEDGEVLHHSDEALSQHRGHGSAKKIP